MKFVKVCPFLRDFGEEFLCVNDDKVTEIVLDPLINVEWSEEMPPVASEVEEGEKQTCLFVLEIDKDEKLFCVSREMYLVFEGRKLRWEDIMDAYYLLSLDNQSEGENPTLDFCSTCLYKVLIASSPIFQTRLDRKEKIKIGSNFLYRKAAEIKQNLEKLTKDNLQPDTDVSKAVLNEEDCLSTEDVKSEFTEQWFDWIIKNIRSEEVTSSSLDWFQRCNEWVNYTAKIDEALSFEEKVQLAKQTLATATYLKEQAIDLMMKVTFLNQEEIAPSSSVEPLGKFISYAGVYFETYNLMTQQFLENVGKKEGEQGRK